MADNLKMVIDITLPQGQVHTGWCFFDRVKSQIGVDPEDKNRITLSGYSIIFDPKLAMELVRISPADEDTFRAILNQPKEESPTELND